MLSRRTCRIAGGIVLLCVLPAAADPPELPRFTCEFRKKDDTFQVVAPKPGAESFRIRSASGIGNATIACREGMWPDTISVLFVEMRYLEHFSIKGNGVILEGQLGQELKPAVFHFNARGERLPDDKGSIYRLAIEHRKDVGVRVILTAPPAARAAKTWVLDWIDAYRR
jgi:hypothetical protein